MTISSVVDIVHGELLNSPSINRIEQVRVNPKKVKRGDLFISLFGNDIDEALANGAYAVIVPKTRNIEDDETAWIGVEDTNQAMLLLLRYLLVQREIRFIHCEEPLFYLASVLLGRNRNVMMLGGPVINLVETLIDREEIVYCLSADSALLETLAPAVEAISVCDETATIAKASLFQTEMAFRGIRHTFPIASRLAPYLVTLLAFCETNALECGWSPGGGEAVFHAVYLTGELKISPVPTDRVLIVDRPFSNEYISGGERYLREHFKWGKIVMFSPHPSDGMKQYTSLEHLQNMLLAERFNYAYVLSEEPEVLIEAFEKEPGRVEASLF